MASTGTVCTTGAAASSSRTDLAASGDAGLETTVAVSSSSGRRWRTAASCCSSVRIEPQWRERHPPLLDRPAIRALFSAVDRRHGEPEQIAPGRIGGRHDTTVVATDGDTRPDEPARLPGQVHVDERQAGIRKQREQRASNPRLEGLEIGFRACRRTQGDAANADERCLLGRGHGARVPDRIAEIEADVQAGQNDIHVFPVIHADSDAVCRRPVDSECRERTDGGGPVRQRSRCRDRRARRRALYVGRDDADLAEFGGHLGQRTNAWAIYAVVVGNEDSHGGPRCKGTASFLNPRLWGGAYSPDSRARGAGLQSCM